MARVGGAVLAVALALGGVPAVARAQVPDHQAWVISPTTGTPRRLSPSVDIAEATAGAAVLFIAFPRVGTARRPVFQNGSAFVEIRGGNTADVGARGRGPAVACSSVGCQPWEERNFDTGMPVKDDYLLVTRNLRASVDPGPGWRAVPVRDTALETTTGDSIKVSADRTSAEMFTTASLPGRGRSAAFVIIPCGEDGTRGSGNAMLSWRPADDAEENPAAYVMCHGQHEDQWRALAIGAGPLTWTLRGNVVGVAQYRTRLAVLTYSA